MTNKKLGSWLCILAVLFAIGETIYFGCNILPTTAAELSCDILAALLFGVGIGLRSKV